MENRNTFVMQKIKNCETEKAVNIAYLCSLWMLKDTSCEKLWYFSSECFSGQEFTCQREPECFATSECDKSEIDFFLHFFVQIRSDRQRFRNLTLSTELHSTLCQLCKSQKETAQICR